jgi:long-subunit fatty acid transport protein
MTDIPGPIIVSEFLHKSHSFSSKLTPDNGLKNDLTTYFASSILRALECHRVEQKESVRSMRSVTAKVIFILLLSSTAAVCQDFNIYPFSMIDYSFLGAGARARAMGGAFTGVANDASALTWNPAGLIQVDKTQASISGTYLPLQLKTTSTYATNPSHNIDSKFTDDKVKPSFASFVAPIRIKGHPFMASATYNSLQDQINEEHNATDFLYYGSAQGMVFYGDATLGSRYTVTGGLNKIALGFGTGLYGDLAFGGSVNIYSGSTESAYYAEFVDVLPYYYGSQLMDSVRFHGVTNVVDKAKASGYNFTTSLFYHKDNFRAGLTVRTPFQMITKHDITRADTLYVRSVKPNSVDVPTANKPSLYLGKTKIDIPTDITVGMSYQITPNFLVAGDFEYANYAKSKYFARVEVDSQTQMSSLDSLNTFTLPGSVYFLVPYTGSNYNSAGELIEVFNTFDLKLENSTQFRFGGEYTLKTTAGIIPIRCGFRMAQGPYREVTKLVRDYNGQPQYVSAGADSGQFALGKKVTRTAVSFGTGIHWRQIWLDFAAEFNSEKQIETGTTAWGDYSTEKKRTAPSLIFNFTGFF